MGAAVTNRRTFTAGLLAAVGFALHGLRAQGSDTEGYEGAASLKAHAAARGLLAGMAVSTSRLGTDAAYTRTLAAQCSIVVAENAMKWGPLRPAPDRFDFAAADRFMNFAAAHRMQARGHNLCWHESLPAWFAQTVNKGNAEAYLTAHIATVAGRYRGRLRAWDVVNEAIEPKDGLRDGMRNSPWLQLLGPGYLETAFHAARAADPGALLTYNDYGIETDGVPETTKREAVLALLRRLRKANVPIDAVGIQSHLSAGSAGQIGAGLSDFLEECIDLGLKIFITELDINDDDLAIDDTAERAEAVGDIYGNYLKRRVKHANVTDILVWGVNNRSSWLNAPGEKQRPKHPAREALCLPFDDSFKPQPAFFALRDTMRKRKV